jgi:hypothetical protein
MLLKNNWFIYFLKNNFQLLILMFFMMLWTNNVIHYSFETSRDICIVHFAYHVMAFFTPLYIDISHMLDHKCISKLMEINNNMVYNWKLND